jgi:hypothetical protein
MPSSVTTLEIHADKATIVHVIRYLAGNMSQAEQDHLRANALSVVYFRNSNDLRITDIHFYDEEDPHCVRPALAIFRADKVPSNVVRRWSDFKLCAFNEPKPQPIGPDYRTLSTD